MCESLVSTGNLSAGKTRVEETDNFNDGAVNVHPILPGASGGTAVVYNSQKIPQITEDTDSEGDSRHSLLDQNYQSHIVVLCDGKTNHAHRRRNCFTWAMEKAPYFACVSIICIVALAIVGIVFRNNRASDANLQSPALTSTSSINSSMLKQNINHKFSNIPPIISILPEKNKIMSDTNTTSNDNEYSTATTVSSSTQHKYIHESDHLDPVVNEAIKLSHVVDNLRALLPCKPRLIKLFIGHAIDDPTNSITDKNLHPQMVAVKRCDHNSSYCGNDIGEELQSKCVAVKSGTRSIELWHRKDEYEFIPIDSIEIREDLECDCM